MVDAVNNNNSAVYTGIGTGVGLLAGGAYGGHFSKPLLKGDAPSDAFVRRYYDNDAKAQIAKAGEDAKKALLAIDGYKDADNVNKLSEIVKNKAAEFGIKADADKLDDAVNEFVGGETDVAKLKAKMETAYADTAVDAKAASFKDGKELTKLQNAFAKLGENADDNAVKEFVKNNAELLGEKNKDISNLADLKKALYGDGSAKGILAPLVDAKKSILEHFDPKDGIKNLEANAEEAAKSTLEAVKKAAKDTKLWAGAKWAIGLGAVLGLGSYIGSKLAAPKVAQENEEQA